MNAEYFSAFRPPILDGVHYQDMIAEGKILSPHTLFSVLRQAREFLTSEPGPHLFQRKKAAPEWIDWWIEHFKPGLLDTAEKTEQKFVHSSKLMAIHEIGDELRDDKKSTSGALFMAGGEGTSGHRLAVDWMKMHVDKPVVLLEGEKYMETKERGGSFLPLEVRLSMWCHYPETAYVGVIPSREEGVDINTHYQRIFDLTGASYSFATENDPNLQIKIIRGRKASFTTIPLLPNISTSRAVQKLLSNIDRDELYDL